MESFEGQKTKIRRDISTRLDALEDVLAEELNRKLAERDRSIAIEKQHYIQEIETLRSSAARAEELELENGRLVAELESTEERKRRRSATEDSHAPERKSGCNAQEDIASTARTVAVEEYDRIKDLLSKSDKDYAKVAFARQVLEFKLRHYKDMTKQWREYTNRWILKHPKNGSKSFEPGASKVSPAPATRSMRYSSAPAPPAVPDGMTPSISDASRDTSPGIDLDRAQDRHGGNPPLTPKWSPGRIIATQRAIDDGHTASSAGLTEASEESDRPQSPSPEAHNINAIENIDSTVEKLDEHVGSSPIIISERSLKRKKPIKVHEDDSRSKTPAVKNEVSSSPPVLPSSLHYGGLYDSIDLDDVGGHIDTPRKRQKLEELRLGSTLMSPVAVRDKERTLDDLTNQALKGDLTIKDERYKQIPSFRPPSPGPAADHRAQDNREQQRKSRKATVKAQQQAHNKRVSERLDDVEQSIPGKTRSSISKCVNSPRESLPALPGPPAPTYPPMPAIDDNVRPRTRQGRRELEHRVATLASPIILKSTDPNAHILPRTHQKFSNQKSSCPPSRRDHGAAYVPALAEDGDDSPAVDNKPSIKQIQTRISAKAPKAPDLYHRLDSLLSKPTPTKSLVDSTKPSLTPPKTASLITPVVRSDLYGPSTSRTTPPSMPTQRPLPVPSLGDKARPRQDRGTEAETEKGPKSAQVSNTNQSVNPVLGKLRSTDRSADTRPEHEPLRARPLHRLRIEDFKLNPAHSDYAYHESVRKHDEKKALSGCTDRKCRRCKDIRKFVENSGYAHLPGQDQEEADRRLLEDFLGKDEDRLKSLSAEERHEILLQARSQQFANHFGKHRTPFQRAQSPVGYWNVGFPSTQEHQQNLEAVRAREREQVKEMYWEAVRERGRYKFADE